MSRRALAVLATSVVLLVAVLPVSVIAAQPQAAAPTAHRFARASLPEGQKIDKKLSAGDPKRQISVIVQLAGKPVAVRQAEAGAALSASEKRKIRAALAVPQARVAATVRSLGGRVIGTMSDAYDGVQARIRADRVGRLAALPGVVKVHAAPQYRLDNTRAVPYLEVPTAWADSGATGDGITIAVIDTGIDFYHANFEGSGDPADFTYGEAHDTTAPAFNADGTTQAFPSAKVIGGYDFVGDDYNADPASPDFQPVPNPDPNPLDCAANLGGGHGSHTAGSAAGFGVLDTGATFGGPYDADTFSDNTFLVGPGVAPDASIVAYRVFGCAGSTEIVTLAIDRAVADGANVINMSLGATFGEPDGPDAVASDNAAAAGVVVVASAGNEGSNAYMTGSPGTGARVISVAALDATTPTIAGAIIPLASGAVTGALNNDGSLPVTGPL